ncbi:MULTISPECIES: S1 family peptidase [unclassified Mycobacteroides]|uniref:Rv1815 family serine proteinase n=1 Tax=unclassified Mycobacteroides TaxID=2618759 RepID=UPI000B282B9A|nr:MULTISPECIES: S1 family peptidase [unclassified Mycobacteroides]
MNWAAAWVRASVSAVMLVATVLWAPSAAATGGSVLVYPGMTIIQGDAKCTLAFIDMSLGIGYSAGHCNSGRTVTDESGAPIGVVMVSRNSRAGMSTTGPDDSVIDYETISLNSNVDVTTRLGPALAHSLVERPGVVARPGMVVCHHGATTGASCGEIDAVHDGWFTMRPGTLSSDHGDSGGPVYTYTDAAGSAPVIVGILRGRNGSRTAAVSWQSTVRQAMVDAAAVQGN